MIIINQADVTVMHNNHVIYVMYAVSRLGSPLDLWYRCLPVIKKSSNRM